MPLTGRASESSRFLVRSDDRPWVRPTERSEKGKSATEQHLRGAGNGVLKHQIWKAVEIEVGDGRKPPEWYHNPDTGPGARDAAPVPPCRGLLVRASVAQPLTGAIDSHIHGMPVGGSAGYHAELHGFPAQRLGHNSAGGLVLRIVAFNFSLETAA